MNQLITSKDSPSNKGMQYKLRFISMHEGEGGGFEGNEEETEDEEEPQAHYFGYLCNFATSQWFQIDDDDVEEVEEKIVLQDSKDKAYMLHYILCGSEEYDVCYQEDKSLFSSPKSSPMAVTAASTTKSSATPSATRPPETSERNESKGLTSKGKDGLTNPEIPEEIVAPATPESKKHPPEAIHSVHPKCSWTISSMGCLLPAVEPRDMCGIEGCQLVLHHMCQTEWESHQYHLEFPNGDPSLSKYDSGGKKRCIHHHPHSKVALGTVLPSTAQAGVDNPTTATLVASKGAILVDSKVSVSQSASEDKEIGKETNAKDMDVSHVAEPKQLSVLKSTTTMDLYLRAVKEMYPGINTGRLSSNMTFDENWAQVRATAALKAFTTVRNMISEKKIVYDDRTSFSDDESSDGSPTGCVQRKPKKKNMDRRTRSSSLVYQPAMPCFLPLILEMFQKVIARLQIIMYVGEK